MGGTGYQPVRRGNLPRRMGRRLELSASSLSVERLTRFARLVAGRDGLVARSTQNGSCRAATSSAAFSGATKGPETFSNSERPLNAGELSQRDNFYHFNLTHCRKRFTSVDAARANVNPYPEMKVRVDEILRRRAAKL